MKKLFFGLFSLSFILSPEIHAHCQMPCGIYHDEILFDEGDQYIETMYKGLTVLNNSKFTTPHERNEFVRWVVTKDNLSNALAEQFLSYFLQQKIKPGEEDTAKKLVALHELLFTLVQIKQNVDIEMIKKFSKQWDEFKLLFHRVGYEFEIEKMRMKKWDEISAKLLQEHEHEHDHQDAAAIKKPVDSAASTTSKPASQNK